MRFVFKVVYPKVLEIVPVNALVPLKVGVLVAGTAPGIPVESVATTVGAAVQLNAPNKNRTNIFSIVFIVSLMQY